MEKEFVPYELALKLKELGFNEDFLGEFVNVKCGYDQGIKFCLSFSNYEEFCGHPEHLTFTPLWQQAFDWFRKEKDFDLNINPMSFVGVTMYYDIHIQHPEHIHLARPIITGKTYEEARLACLEKLIEIVKSRNHGINDKATDC